MADMLATGAAWVARQRRNYLSKTVTFRRGSVAVEVPATVGESTVESDSNEGVVTQWTTRDYLIDAACLILPGIGQVYPEAGDLIEEMTAAGVETCEVSSAPAEGPWRWHDREQTTLRIHTTRLIAAEPVF